LGFCNLPGGAVPSKPRSTERKRQVPRRAQCQAAPAVPRRALEVAWIEFIDENGGGPGCGYARGNRRKDNPLVRTARVHQRVGGQPVREAKKSEKLGPLMFC
jgi:hypothetical protein